jgi:formate dehydrogenase subunit gamma
MSFERICLRKQLAQTVHSVVAMPFIAMMLAHIYIGTIGMEGAFEAMGSGTVDVNWAREHHDLWLEEQNARTSARPHPPPLSGKALSG